MSVSAISSNVISRAIFQLSPLPQIGSASFRRSNCPNARYLADHYIRFPIPNRWLAASARAWLVLAA